MNFAQKGFLNTISFSLAFGAWLLGPEVAFASSDPIRQAAEQVQNQIQVAKVFGNAKDAEQAKRSAAEFKRKYSNQSQSPEYKQVVQSESELGQLQTATQKLSSCEKTEADVAGQIIEGLRSAKRISAAPGCNKKSSNTTEISNLKNCSRSIGSQALLNDLKSRFDIQKRYVNPQIGEAAIGENVNAICPTTDSLCTKELRDWLAEQAKTYVRSKPFKDLVYRDYKTVAGELSKKFTDLNYNYVLSANERKYYNIHDRHEKVMALSQRAESLYKKNPRDPNYPVALKAYKTALDSYHYDEKQLKLYEKLSPEADTLDYTDNGRNYGLRNACTSGSFSAKLFSEYRNEYAKIAQVDDKLLFTPIFKENRMQVDGWVKNATKCPDAYPASFTPETIKKSVQQALAMTQNSSAKQIRDRIAHVNQSRSSEEITDEASKWLEQYPTAVTNSLASRPQDIQCFCGLLSAVKGHEDYQRTKDRIIMGATYVGAATMLVVPVVGEGSAAFMIGAAGTATTIAGAGANYLNKVSYADEGDALVNSIISGNSNLRGLAKDAETREKVETAYRQMVMDLAMAPVQALEILQTMKAAESLPAFMARAAKAEKAAESTAKAASVARKSETVAEEVSAASSLKNSSTGSSRAVASSEAKVEQWVSEVKANKDQAASWKSLENSAEYKRLSPQKKQALKQDLYEAHITGKAADPKVKGSTPDRAKKLAIADARKKMQEKYGFSAEQANQHVHRLGDDYVLGATEGKTKILTKSEIEDFEQPNYTLEMKSLGINTNDQAAVKSYFESKLKTAGEEYAQVVAHAESLPDLQKVRLLRKWKEYIGTVHTRVAERSGGQVADAFAQERGLTVKGGKVVDYKAPTEGGSVASAGEKVASGGETSAGAVTHAVSDAESLQTAKKLQSQFQPETIANENKSLYQAVQSSQLKETLTLRVQEQEQALSQLQTVKQSLSPAEATGLENTLKNSIEKLKDQQKSLDDLIKARTKLVNNLDSGDTRAYSLQNSLDNLGKNKSADEYFAKQVRDEIDKLNRTRKNFTDAEIPGLRSKAVDDHLERLEKYLKDYEKATGSQP